MEDIRCVSCLPTFSISIAGPHMMIQGFVLAGKFIAQPLTDYIWLGGEPGHRERITRLAHIFHALRICLASLEDCYGALDLSSDPGAARLLPYIKSLPDSTEIEYVGPLLPVDSPYALKKALFKARRVHDNRPLVVKFVDSFCEKAHRLWAEHGFAPALHHFELVCHGLYMVVVNFEKNTRDGYSLYEEKPLPVPVLAEVKRAVQLLHQHGYVFGDLRYPNILVRDRAGPATSSTAGHDENTGQSYSVMLVDFDCCGLDGEARYPNTLNDLDDIQWPLGVRRGGIMLQEHNLAMLAKTPFVGRST
ncbi:hypothetical protein BC835DRAFT_1379474 [Cytidiella melzeri]|nr:hypothetical protein BC835DRAFT_1379474 [Cytidiella melzeri]